MSLQLIPNWGRTLTHGYSAWCIYAAGGVHFASNALPYLSDVIPWWVSLVILALALVVRPIKQASISGEDDDG